MPHIKRDHSLLRGVIITAVVFALFLGALVYSLSRVDAMTQREQKAALKEAVLGATLMCYSVEGRYPRDVDYLAQHYGIYYDSNRYIVSISGFADNVLPEIRVLEKGKD